MTEEDDILETYINAAIIIRTTVEEYIKLKKTMHNFPHTKVLYQKMSAGRLTVVEQTNEEVKE